MQYSLSNSVARKLESYVEETIDALIQDALNNIDIESIVDDAILNNSQYSDEFQTVVENAIKEYAECKLEDTINNLEIDL